MKPVEQIKLPIQNEMELFEEKFKASMLTKVPLLNRITYYIVRRKGKQMRPMFVFLVAKMVSNGQFKERTYRGASIIELIHTATLVHDDVVDDSNTRRGFFSLNALWKNKIAVLVGDYLLSKGLLLSIDNDDFDILKQISIAVREMSEGELLQIEKARQLNITEEVYFEIIRKKTATLIAACTAIGAASVDAPKDEVEKMRKFGELIGIAFQIKDDLFDYTEEKIGKPTGMDIKEQKMTLPLIYTLNHCSKKERRWLINSRAPMALADGRSSDQPGRFARASSSAPAWCVTATGGCPAGRASIVQRLSAVPDLAAFSSPRWTSSGWAASAPT